MQNHKDWKGKVVVGYSGGVTSAWAAAWALRSLTSSTPAQADMETANRTAYEKLKKMGQDSSTADAARQKAAEILKAADYPAPEGESLDDLLKTFRQAIINAATDNGKLTDLYNAV